MQYIYIYTLHVNGHCFNGTWSKAIFYQQGLFRLFAQPRAQVFSSWFCWLRPCGHGFKPEWCNPMKFKWINIANHHAISCMRLPKIFSLDPAQPTWRYQTHGRKSTKNCWPLGFSLGLSFLSCWITETSVIGGIVFGWNPWENQVLCCDKNEKGTSQAPPT